MFATLIYLAAVVAANLSVAAFGPIVTPINAFFLIGLDLSLRDVLHARWSGDRLVLRMGLLIATAGAISYALNPASETIALASVIAFVVSNTADALVFQRLAKAGYLVRSNASNTAGAALDSLIFPSIAFGGFLPAVVLGQFVAKVAGGALWSLVFKKLRPS